MDDEVVIDATEQPVATETDDLRHALAEKDAELLARSESEREMLVRYREVLLAGDTGVDPSLVEGDNLAAIDESFARARDVADRARGSLGPGMQRVSPGAPGRRKVVPTTAFEKIREGLNRRVG
jgi:hypothetical protein